MLRCAANKAASRTNDKDYKVWNEKHDSWRVRNTHGNPLIYMYVLAPTFAERGQ